jgi:hypothetical protein
MSDTIAEIRTLAFEAPTGLLARGWVAVFGGRGETPEVYGRFGRRIASDSYPVLAFGDEPETSPSALADVIVAWLGEQAPAPEGFARHLTLVGSDTGVLRAVDVAAVLGDRVDAVVLAAYPVAAAAALASDWEQELLERTTCPLHRKTLDADPNLGRGSFASGLDGVDLDRDLTVLSPAVLAVHGGADSLSRIDEVLPRYRAAREAQIWVVDGAKHDVLNDGAHRSVAATIVQFLEGRRGPSGTQVARRVD